MKRDNKNHYPSRYIKLYNKVSKTQGQEPPTEAEFDDGKRDFILALLCAPLAMGVFYLVYVVAWLW